jgi:TetR/AcrR family transcriptional regulator of autoinduction and epiphytic fitness
MSDMSRLREIMEETMANRTDDTELDPRVERTRRLVLSATLKELSEVGYGALTIDSIATRAGVARSTIYRNWPDKMTVINDALEILNVQSHAFPEKEQATAIDKVEALLVHLTSVMTDSIISDCLSALVGAAELHPEVAQFLHNYSSKRRQTLVKAIEEGVSRGEFADDLDPELAALALSGPIFYCRLMTDRPFELSQVKSLIEIVLFR